MIELFAAALLLQQDIVDCRSSSIVAQVLECVARDPEVERYQAELANEGIDCQAASNTRDMNTCVGLDLARETARMNLYLEAAGRRADEQDREQGFQPEDRTFGGAWLAASQHAWQAYAGIACEGVFDQWKGGSVRMVAVLGCWIDLTRDRTHVIWRHHLTYPDSTPPILPEPVLPVRGEIATAG